MDHLAKLSGNLEHKRKLEMIGDDFAVRGLSELAAKSYIFAHANPKLRFIVNSSEDMHADLVYCSTVSGNFDAFKFLVSDKKKPISKKTLDFVFDKGGEKLLDFVMSAEFWKSAGNDPSLVASVSIMQHLLRARTGAIEINTVFESWGPIETQFLFKFVHMKPEIAYEKFSKGELGYVNRNHLIMLMLYAVLAALDHRLSSREVSHAMKDMTPQIVSELLEYHKYIFLKPSDMKKMIIDSKNSVYIPEFIGMMPLLVSRTDDPVLSEIFYAYGAETVISYLRGI